ncbi:MAG: antibiotic biosynthesis monooxygenase [Myxococcota bacterium]
MLEVAPLAVRSGSEGDFERAFAWAQTILTSMPSYRSHELMRCLERPVEYPLLVRWDSPAAHEQGFRDSPRHLEWKSRLHHFRVPFPTPSHHAAVGEPDASRPADAGVRADGSGRPRRERLEVARPQREE